MNRYVALTMLTAVVALIGCEYDVPITAEPTRKIETSLLGEWTSTEWTDKDCKDRLKVRKYDDSSYVFSDNDTLFRAWHSDIDETPFITVQNLDSPERKYSYFLWSLADGGKSLVLKLVKSDVFPKETRDSAEVVKILRANSANPKLLDDPATFTRKR